MKVTLKKAGALAAALLAIPVKLDHAYAVDPFADPPDADFIDNATLLLTTQVQQAHVHIECAYILRKLIGEANKAQIDDLLAQRAVIEKLLSVANSLPKRERHTNMIALARQIEVARAQPAPAFVGRNPFTIELATTGVIDHYNKPLKRKLRELDEALQAANFNTTIEIPEPVVKVLTALDLV